MTDYERIRAILDAATPGPWTMFGGYDALRRIASTADSERQWTVGLPDDGSVPGFMRDPEADARAIVVSRNLAPELLAVAETGEAVVASWDCILPLSYGEQVKVAEAVARHKAALDALDAKIKETLA